MENISIDVFFIGLIIVSFLYFCIININFKVMKIKLLLIFSLVFFLFTSANLQDDTASKITNAIKNANAKELAVYFNSSIELVVLDYDGTYSKAQAEIIVKDFFAKYPPASFSINHQGASKDASHFYIGSYKTKSSVNYRVYFLLKSFSNKLLIQNLQIEAQ